MRKTIDVESIIRVAQFRVKMYETALAKGKAEAASMYLADVTMAESILSLAIEADMDTPAWDSAWLENHKRVWGRG